MMSSFFLFPIWLCRTGIPGQTRSTRYSEVCSDSFPCKLGPPTVLYYQLSCTIYLPPEASPRGLNTVKTLQKWLLLTSEVICFTAQLYSPSLCCGLNPRPILPSYHVYDEGDEGLTNCYVPGLRDLLAPYNNDPCRESNHHQEA